MTMKQKGKLMYKTIRQSKHLHFFIYMEEINFHESNILKFSERDIPKYMKVKDRRGDVPIF